MEGMESQSQSQCWGSYTSPENSICLAENVEGFQQCANEILKLIQQDGNLSELTPEVYDHKKSELATHVADLSRMHNVLAEQHGRLIEELSRNIPSPIRKQHQDSSDSSSPQVSHTLTPDQMSNTHKFRTPIGFDALLSSGGGGSYVSRRECSESSSFSLSSDSDSESFISINKLLVSPVNDDTLKAKEIKGSEVLLKKIADLEEEIVSLNSKLQNLTEENSKTQNTHLETQKAKVAELRILIRDSNIKIESMGHALEASRQKLSTAEDEISTLKQELSSKIFEKAHWLQGQLGSTQEQMALLQKQLDSEKDKVSELQEEVLLCVVDISVRDDQIRELNTNISQSTSEISALKMKLTEKRHLVDDLNKKLDTLTSEKDGVNAQLDTLQAETYRQDSLIRELKNNMNELQVKHARVISSFDNAQKVSNELRLRVAELEREVGRQREVISDRAEEKREAIRQLSFSLEHYMSGYKELRQAFIGHKRHAVLTS